ncbi:MAG: hypothetical protein L0287_23795 [Anaerolineae bacterium]|nr:hypothetical protein [Anaerolineae bacterium]MCI0607707.1 hypothetical protein [Anaerolineae bacterium]
MADDRLERAIGLVQSGKIGDARNLLELIIKDDRNNIPAWHWYAQTWPEARDKIRVWEVCLRFNPTNQQAREALSGLKPQQPKKVNPEANIPGVKTVTTATRSSQWLLIGSIGLLIVVAILAWMVVQSSVPKDPQQYKHTQPVEYYLYVPEAYFADQAWPLFVGIHGAGGSGLDCWNLWQSYADTEGFILLCPSIPGDPSGFYQDVGERTVWSAIGEVQREYRTRPGMFFTGVSAGAMFVQGFTTHYPQHVSGLSILSSGFYFDPRSFINLIPIAVVIGDQDDATAVRTSQIFVSNLRNFGFDVQYELMPGVGHAVTSTSVDVTIEVFRKTVP